MLSTRTPSRGAKRVAIRRTCRSTNWLEGTALSTIYLLVQPTDCSLVRPNTPAFPRHSGGEIKQECHLPRGSSPLSLCAHHRGFDDAALIRLKGLHETPKRARALGLTLCRKHTESAHSLGRGGRCNTTPGLHSTHNAARSATTLADHSRHRHQPRQRAPCGSHVDTPSGIIQTTDLEAPTWRLDMSWRGPQLPAQHTILAAQRRTPV